MLSLASVVGATLLMSPHIALQPRRHACSPSAVTASAASAPPAVVIGGGVSGLCVALELSRRGYEVTVVSRRREEAASLAAGGMLAPQSERLGGEYGEGRLLDLALAARDYFPHWVRALEQAAGADVGLCASGGFVAPAFTNDAVHRWTPPPRAGKAVWLDQSTLRATEPLISPEAVGGWWYPQDLSVDPRAFHSALLSACDAAGVLVKEGAEAVALELSADGAAVRHVRLADSSTLPAAALVLCGGAWLRDLLPVPLRPIKGEMLSLRPPPVEATAFTTPTSTIRRVLFADRCYIIPRRDGRIVVGATVEPQAGFDLRSTAGGVKSLLSAAMATVPALAEYTLDETWAGLRPSTPDLLPLLGATPWSNTHLACGYHRNGILLAPLCARLIAESIDGQLDVSDAALIKPFQWDRFMSTEGVQHSPPVSGAAAGAPLPLSLRPPHPA